jgi:hypothetical protein
VVGEERLRAALPRPFEKGAMLVPHRRDDAEFGEGGGAADQLDEPRVFALSPCATASASSTLGSVSLKGLRSFSLGEALGALALRRRKLKSAGSGRIAKRLWIRDRSDSGVFAISAWGRARQVRLVALRFRAKGARAIGEGTGGCDGGLRFWQRINPFNRLGAFFCHRLQTIARRRTSLCVYIHIRT